MPTTRKPKPTHPLSHLPTSLTHWLGYRPYPPPPPHSKEPRYAVYLWSFIGSFAGLAILQVIFRQEVWVRRGVVGVVGSWGASAVLCYSTLSSPLAQPRPLILGHLLAALTSIALTKFFLLLPSATFTRLEPLLGALATGLAIVFMQATGTVHPPAGATALLAAVDKDVRGLGWFLVPVTGVCGGVVLVSACLVGNLQRRWPVFWWVAGDVDGWVEEGEGDVGERGERGNGDGGDGGEKGLVREGKGDGGEKGLVVRGDCRREVSDNLDGGGNAVSAKGEGSRSSVTLGRGHGERGS